MTKIEQGGHLWVKKGIYSEISGMQIRFDGFEQWISQKLVGIQALDLVRVHGELTVLKDTIDEMHVTSFPTYLIIKKIL